MEYVKVLIEELEDTWSRDAFEKFSSPEELHCLAQYLSWETKEEMQTLQWICESNICSQATALMLFWLAQPQDFTSYKFGAKVPHDDGAFVLIQTILDRFGKGSYQHYGINYDPHDIMAVEEYEVDEQMKKAVIGEETWYDEDYIKKIAWYTPSELESEIIRCEDRDYLNMIANGLCRFMDGATVAELIIQNPNCDTGTALLLYWRLLQFYVINRNLSIKETEKEHPILNQLREKILAAKFINGIAYEPLKDSENDRLLGKVKSKWKIPEYMKQAV
jgi:hypothetical protein